MRLAIPNGFGYILPMLYEIQFPSGNTLVLSNRAIALVYTKAFNGVIVDRTGQLCLPFWRFFGIIPNMIQQNMTISKNETIALIIEHLVNQGYNDADKFVNYITMVLPMMSTSDLQAELEALECNT